METTLLCCKIERNERMNIIHGLLHPQKKNVQGQRLTCHSSAILNQQHTRSSTFVVTAKIVVKVLCMFQEKSGPGLKTSHLVRVTLSAVKYLHCRSRSWRQQPQPCWQRKLTQSRKKRVRGGRSNRSPSQDSGSFLLDDGRILNDVSLVSVC